MGVSMSKFSAMTRNELHLFSLMLQVGALTNSPTMGGESATTEQSAPVKPDTDRLLLLDRIAAVATYIYFNLFMAALWNRAGHFIFALLLLSSSSFFFFSPNLSGRRLDVYHTSTHGVASGLSANLECRSEICCTRLAENAGRKKSRKIRHLVTIAHFVGLCLRN